MESIANKSTGRRATRPVCLGGVQIGGEARVSVQTMTKTDTGDAEATLAQIKQVAAAGADLVRVALPNAGVLGAFERICAESPLPVVADVHFDYRLAVEAARRGAAKLRINPGNLGGRERLAAVLEAAHEKGIPVRVGVNAGSLPQDLEERHGGPTAEAMAQAAQRMVAEAQELGFSDLVVSLKASDVPRTVQANRLFAAESDLPLHLGVTEAGLGHRNPAGGGDRGHDPRFTYGGAGGGGARGTTNPASARHAAGAGAGGVPDLRTLPRGPATDRGGGPGRAGGRVRAARGGGNGLRG
jgi:1-hydroxy-2-methyl-2-(E)-butenyl 4-diphosphate synthase